MQKTWQKVAVTIAVSFILMLIFQIALFPFLGGLILAYLLSPLTDFFAKKFPRGVSILLVYLLLAGFLFLLARILLPGIYEEVSRLVDYLPSYMAWLEEKIKVLQNICISWAIPWDVSSMLAQGILSLQTGISNGLKQALLFLPDLVSNLIPIALIPVSGFYFLRDRDLICRRLKSFVPPKIRTAWSDLWWEINHILRKYLKGYLVLAFVVGTLFGLAMALLGMDYALLLGLFMGLGEFIPYFGPFLAVLPAVFFAAFHSVAKVIQVLALFFLIQQLESLFLTPRIIGKSVGLHPLAVILALMTASHWLGFWGLLWGVPLLASLFYSCVWLYRRRAGAISEK